EHYATRPYVRKGSRYEEYRPAYRYGWETRGRYTGKSFDEVEPELRAGWEKSKANKGQLAWARARHAVRDAWDRLGGGETTAATGKQAAGEKTLQLHEEELRPRKQPVEKGEVRVRKEVVTEHKTVDVPVRREEVVIERRPAGRKAGAADLRAEEVRIPV